MKLYHRLLVCLLSGMLLASSLTFMSCDNDDLETNPFAQSGVNLLGFGPCPLKRLDNMRVIGTQLNKVDKVLFPKGNSLITDPVGYEEADFQLISSEELEVTVPDETVPGKLRLVVGTDTIVSVSNITFEEEITVDNITPTQGLHAGDIITITGDYVWNIASVTFSENVEVEAESFLVNTRKEIQVRVPVEAQSGTLSYSNGTTEVVWDEPLEIHQAVITGMSSTELDFGDLLTIYGSDLDLVTTVKFPLLTVETPFTVNDDATELTVTVPDNTVSGKISLIQYSGLMVQTAEITLPMAEYESIAPAVDLNVGDVVTITGKNLDRIVSVTLPGDIVLSAGGFEQDATQIRFTVPTGMGDGAVLLTQHENYSVQTDRIAMYYVGDGTVIWSGAWTCSGWTGNQDLAWGGYDWSTLTLGQSIVFTIGFVDPTSGWAAIKPCMGNGWANLSVGQIDLVPSEEDQDVVFQPTADDITALQNEGGLVVTGDGFILKRVTIR